MPSAIAEQQHREGPDHVQGPGDHGVDPAAVVAGEQAEDDARAAVVISAADDADEQRGAAAVHQPHHLVAAEAAVGAEEELAAGVEPLRADRLAVGADDVALFAVDVDLLQRVGRRWARCGRRGRPRAAPPGRRRRSGRRGRGRRARPGCARKPPPGEAPGASPRSARLGPRPSTRSARYLNSKLVRSLDRRSG